MLAIVKQLAASRMSGDKRLPVRGHSCVGCIDGADDGAMIGLGVVGTHVGTDVLGFQVGTNVVGSEVVGCQVGTEVVGNDVVGASV